MVIMIHFRIAVSAFLLLSTVQGAMATPSLGPREERAMCRENNVWPNSGEGVGPTTLSDSELEEFRELPAGCFLGEPTCKRGESGVDREHLAAAMWPDERLAAESRDQRLHTRLAPCVGSGSMTRSRRTKAAIGSYRSGLS